MKKTKPRLRWYTVYVRTGMGGDFEATVKATSKAAAHKRARQMVVEQLIGAE